jgi:hypothetical protein
VPPPRDDWRSLPRRLPRKLWGRLIALARRLPGVAARERRHYAALEAALLGLSGNRGTGTPTGLPLPPAPVIRQALAAGPDYRLIDLAAPGDDDAVFLAARRLNPAHISANRGLIPRAYLPPGRMERRLALGLDTDPDRTAFQLEALDQAAVEAVCPVTGRLRRSIHGLLAAQNQPIFYWFPADGDAPAMLLAVGREGRGWIKLYLFLPALGTALLLAERVRWHGRDEIDELRAHLLAAHRAVRSYLARTDPPRPWVLVDSAQFAHHLWNALTGLERLAAHIDRVPVAGVSLCAEPWGPLEALFPELADTPVHRERFPAPIARAMGSHRLLIRVGGTRIGEALLGRVRRVAAGRVAPAVQARAAALRRRRRPILWVTLRLENRTWVSQVPGLIEIGRRLAADHPHAALIIDGFSVLHDAEQPLPAEHARLIAAEGQAAASIGAALAGLLPVVSLVGRPLLEAVIFARIADCYFAHQGSLQHKIGWLGDCPGLVHANRLVLTTPLLWEAALEVRPAQHAPVYLDPTLVRDVPGAARVANNRWLDDLDNYELDATDAYAALSPLLHRAAEGHRRRGETAPTERQ